MPGICIQYIYCMETSVSPLSFYPPQPRSSKYNTEPRPQSLESISKETQQKTKKKKNFFWLRHVKDLSSCMRDWAHASLKRKHRVFITGPPGKFQDFLTPLRSLQRRVSSALVNYSAVSSNWSLAWSCSQISLVAGRETPRPQFCGSLFDCNPMAMCGFSRRCGKGALNWSKCLCQQPSILFHGWLVSWESVLLLKLDKNLTFKLYFIWKCFRFPHLGGLS